MFCPKCGSILVPKKERHRQVLACKCGYKNTEVGEVKFKESVKKQEEVTVVEKEHETLPLTQEECPKCEHDKAYFWELQTRSADEPPTRFFRCEKCKHTWRLYK